MLWVMLLSDNVFQAELSSEATGRVLVFGVTSTSPFESATIDQVNYGFPFFLEKFDHM
jgi:hypothetical protein